MSDEEILYSKVPVRILVTAKSAHVRLKRLLNKLHADAVDPIDYKCLRCKTEWDDSPLRDYRQVTCSNCYGERVILTSVRLSFLNCGEHNGGEMEQRRRFVSAKKVLAKVIGGGK